MNSFSSASSIPDLGSVHYSRRYGYTYVSSPKTGCSTIKGTLNAAEGASVVGAREEGEFGYSALLQAVHDRNLMVLDMPSSQDEFQRQIAASRIVFAFVRNPYTRILSAYLDKVVNPRRGPMFLSKLGAPADAELSFGAFVDLVGKQSPGEMDPHWHIQSRYIGFGGVPYTHVGSFENFAGDLRDILSAIDPILSDKVLSVNEHRTKAREWFRRFYDDTIKKRVEEIYDSDFTAFGYDRSLDQALRRPTSNRPV